MSRERSVTRDVTSFDGANDANASSRRLRIAIQIGQEHADYGQLREAAVAADELGADIIFNWDHFFPNHGEVGKHFECFTMLASLAEVTRRVELGPLVSCVCFRNPNLVADMARTIDHISGGKFILGLGAGWYEPDFSEYGFEFATVAQRLRRLENDVATVRLRMGRLNPPPRRHIPLLIGGAGEGMTLRIVASMADIWHENGDVAHMRHKISVLDDWCHKIGRDPSEIERAGTIDLPADPSLGDELVAIGVSTFVCEFVGPKFDFRPAEDWLAWRDERNRSPRPMSSRETSSHADAGQPR